MNNLNNQVKSLFDEQVANWELARRNFAGHKTVQTKTFNFDDFDIKVSGEISKQPPIEYVAVHLIYSFKGLEEYKQAALEAVTFSQGTQCGVSSMLKKIMPVTWEVHYNGILSFSNKKESLANS